jgi:hypothetical protein
MPSPAERRQAADRADRDLVARAATWLRDDPGRPQCAGLQHDHVADALADLLDALAAGVPTLDQAVRAAVGPARARRTDAGSANASTVGLNCSLGPLPATMLIIGPRAIRVLQDVIARCITRPPDRGQVVAGRRQAVVARQVAVAAVGQQPVVDDQRGDAAMRIRGWQAVDQTHRVTVRGSGAGILPTRPVVVLPCTTAPEVGRR